jgi:Leucine-rich repeat (LRR) protein
LRRLNCSGTQLASIDVSGLSSLTNLYVGANAFLSALDASGLTELTEIVCGQSAISSLNLNGCTALKYLDAAYCALGSVSAVGVMFSSGLFDKKGRPKEVPTIYLNNNSMTGTNINNFFLTLSAVSPGSVVLDMRNNYGFFEDTGEWPQISGATNKGYVVITS